MPALSLASCTLSITACQASINTQTHNPPHCQVRQSVVENYYYNQWKWTAIYISSKAVIFWCSSTMTSWQQHPFSSPLSGTTQVSQYQKGKANLDVAEARDSQWQWHQLNHMQICTSPQTDNHASTPTLCFFTGRMPFLPCNQQRQRTEVVALQFR